MGVLYDELKRRKVFRVSAAYVVVAWLMIQVADIVFPRLSLPDWTITLVLILLLIGFPIAVILAWAYDVTPDGVIRTDDARDDRSGPRPKGPGSRHFVAAALVAALGIVAYQTLGPEPDAGLEQVTGNDKSVAVLPFDDLSERGDQGWFCDGLTEEILHSLARLPELDVISRTSSFHFRGKNMPLREIATRLGVAHIVEGSVRQSGERLRVTVQLIRAADDRHVWSENYDATADDVFSVQEDVAEKIAEALDVFLDDAKREAMFAAGTRNVQAWKLYSQAAKLEYDWYEPYGIGDQLWQSSSLTEKALELDPDFLTARFLHIAAYTHFGMGDNYDGAPKDLTHDKAQAVILDDLDRAATLARNAGQRQLFRLNRIYYSSDWRGFPALVDSLNLREIQDVIHETVSSNNIDVVLSLMGRNREALDFLEEALRRSPYDPSIWWHVSGAAFGIGGPDLALQYIEKVPAEFATVRVRKSIFTLIAAGRPEEALAIVDEYKGTDYVRPDGVMRALALAHAGRKAEAREMLAAIPPDIRDHWVIAWAMDAAGEREGAEAMYRSIDAKAGGAQVLAGYATTLFGGKLFHDIAWTPNLAARFAEAGVTPERLEIPGPVEVAHQ